MMNVIPSYGYFERERGQGIGDQGTAVSAEPAEITQKAQTGGQDLEGFAA